MEKEKVIQLIEQELMQADEASSKVEFEKHIYAIRTLTELVTSDSNNVSFYEQRQVLSKSAHSQGLSQSNTSVTTNQPKSDEISMAELKAMGGHVPSKQQTSTSDNAVSGNRMVTDDELGNGESIFDF
ncbi:YwdI family protein [Staphylococcus gallinarum]|uniref:DUF5327 family protein n=1 Tax=Staphylococcus gallinarum TaxID=1293 RepID=UPI001E36A3BF|nr:DUF5327 family protein [Staphylococcus gallinarum]MCD8859644.1 YwdI family protein [Staphylococcus gallinarum]